MNLRMLLPTKVPSMRSVPDVKRAQIVMIPIANDETILELLDYLAGSGVTAREKDHDHEEKS